MTLEIARQRLLDHVLQLRGVRQKRIGACPGLVRRGLASGLVRGLGLGDGRTLAGDLFLGRLVGPEHRRAGRDAGTPRRIEAGLVGAIEEPGL
jgi:hypothetical protein